MSTKAPISARMYNTLTPTFAFTQPATRSATCSLYSPHFMVRASFCMLLMAVFYTQLYALSRVLVKIICDSFPRTAGTPA